MFYAIMHPRGFGHKRFDIWAFGNRDDRDSYVDENDRPLGKFVQTCGTIPRKIAIKMLRNSSLLGKGMNVYVGSDESHIDEGRMCGCNSRIDESKANGSFPFGAVDYPVRLT